MAADGCPLATPHATLAVDDDVHSATGHPADNILCPRFIVDVIAAPMGPLSSVGYRARYAGPARSSADCDAYRKYVAVYEKPWISLGSPAKFTFVGGAWSEAQWVAGICIDEWDAVAGSLPTLKPGSTPLGGYTYRIVASNRTTVTRPVTVEVWKITTPK